VNRRDFVAALAAVFGSAMLPSAAAVKAGSSAVSIFGLEVLGFTETLEWHPEFMAWMLTLRKLTPQRNFEYSRLFEEDPRTLPDAILDFYRDHVAEHFLPIVKES
jgi:hypothetical protein